MTSHPPLVSPPSKLARHPAGGETTLYLVRHGRTVGNAERRLQGVTDLPLDQLGRRQADRIADRLARDVRADVVLTSPLIRARATAEEIGRRLGLEPIVVPTLIEMNFGDLEGMVFETFLEEYPELAAKSLDVSEDSDLAWPNGESRRHFHRRVHDAFESILVTYASHAVVVVAHGGVLGSFLAQVEGRSPNDWRAYQLSNCSLTHVDFRAHHTVVHFSNDVLHLEELGDD